MTRPLTVACLAGDGVGPELMGQATRALSHVAKLHSVAVDEMHLPFAGEGITQSGHSLPQSTRSAYRRADAILVALPQESALEGVKADLELVWRVTSIRVWPAGDVLVVGPAGPGSEEVAIARAFEAAASRRGRVTAVGSSPSWLRLVEVEQAEWGGMSVEHLTVGESLAAMGATPLELDVVVTEAHLVAAIADAGAHLFGSPSSVAHAWLAESGPGVFAPGVSDSAEVAGLGVADPTAMLLTAALLLSEGLKRRAPARTLERAVEAVANGDGSKPDGTRSFTDAVIELMPRARTDVELFDGVWK